jgi:hypothetical protein
MKSILFISLLVLASAFPGLYRGLNTKGVSTVCHQGREHQLKYDVSSNATFVALSEARHVIDQHCNANAQQLLLVFLWPSYQSDFVDLLEQASPVYLTAPPGTCPSYEGPASPMMKRVTAWHNVVGFGLQVDLIDAKYDQVFQTANLNMGPSGAECAIETTVDWSVCLGYNADSTCTEAVNPLTIWQDQYFDIVCSDCYVALETDIFFEVAISDFSLVSMGAGFLHPNLVGSLVIDFSANLPWSTGSDMTYPIVQATNVIDFWVGPVPFHLWFQIPLEIKAEATFDAAAAMAVGATFDLGLGEVGVFWNASGGWSALKPQPNFTWTPSIQNPTIEFNADFSLALTPSFIAYFDEFFTTTTTIAPVLTGQANGTAQTNGAQVCASLQYAVTAETTADLQISIPWAVVTGPTHWEWPLLNTGTQPIGTVCAEVNGNLEKEKNPVRRPIQPLKQPLKPNRQVKTRKLAKELVEREDRPTTLLEGSSDLCIHGRPHRVTYRANVTGQTFVVLDNITSITGLQCNLDSTRLLLTFTDATSAGEFAAELEEGSYVSAGTRLDCWGVPVLRLVLSAQASGNTVQINTDLGMYSQIFQDADITVGPAPESAACLGDTWHVCIPINANNQCSGASGPLTLYQNELLSVTCSNCWLGLEFDVLFNIQMASWALEQFSAGFQNIAANGALVVDFDAAAHWSTGVDKTFQLVPETTVLSVWIGPVPLTINIQVPVDVILNAHFDAKATATIGATADLSIGDASVEWKWDKGWSHQSPSPQLTWTEVLQEPEAHFQAGATVGFAPSWTMSVDGFWSVTMAMDPQLVIAAQGQSNVTSGSVCASVTDSVDVTIASEIDISVPWISLKWDFSYGPEDIYSSGTQTVGQECVATD